MSMSKDSKKDKDNKKDVVIKKKNGKADGVRTVITRAYTTGDEGEIVWGTS